MPLGPIRDVRTRASLPVYTGLLPEQTMPRTMSLWTALFLLPGVANAQGPAATPGQGKDQMPAMTFHDVLEPRQLEWDALYQPASPNSLLAFDMGSAWFM